MIRSVTFVADLRTIQTAPGIGPQTVVALPPSAAFETVGQMRVYVNGVLVIRHYDSDPNS